MTINDRLRQARKQRGFEGAKEAAAYFNWKYPTYAGHENGNRGIKFQDVEKYARAFNVSCGWLAFNEGGVYPASPSSSEGSFPSVPRLDIRLSAGGGAFNDDAPEVLDYIPFTQEFISKKLRRSNTKGLVCAEIYGQSMEPTMSDGDLVIIDRSFTDIGAGVYAVNYEGAAYAKRIERSGKDLLLVPDNPRHETWKVENGTGSGFEVAGKIIWIGRGLE